MNKENIDLKNKNILITGGLGLTGCALSKRLVNLGCNVTIYNRTLKNIDCIENIKNKVRIIEGDISNYEKIKSCVLSKDYIFHLAGQTSVSKSMNNPYLDLEYNCKATLNILESCKKSNKNAKIIFAGTVRESGPIKEEFAIENKREEPTSIFDLHKLTSEKYLQIYNKVYGLKTVTLRLSNIFGYGQIETDPQKSVINHIIKKAIKNRYLEVYDSGNILRDYNFVENVVDAFIKSIMPITDGKFYLIGSREGKSFNDFIKEMKKILEEDYGLNIKIKIIPCPDIVSKTVQGNLVVDFTKFNEDTGWIPKIKFNEGLKKTIEFYIKEFN